MAMAAWTLDTLAAWPVRLVWCVDLERDVPEADGTVDPSKPDTTRWGQYLTRLRNALNGQPRTGGYEARIALSVRYTTRSSGKKLVITYDLPWSINVALLGKAPPPVGVWRLLWEPQRKIAKTHKHRHRGMPFEGDNLPDSFWRDGIPF